GLWCGAREYTFERKRWIGDTRVSRNGDAWWYTLDRRWSAADATFPPAAPRPGGDGADGHGEPGEYGDASAEIVVLGINPDCEDDLLDDVISWCQIRGDGRLAEVRRVRHRGPW